MEFTGVYHKTSEQMSYPLDEDRKGSLVLF